MPKCLHNNSMLCASSSQRYLALTTCYSRVVMQFLVSLKRAEYLHMGSLSSIASSWGESVRSAEKRVKPVPRVCRDGA